MTAVLTSQTESTAHVDDLTLTVVDRTDLAERVIGVTFQSPDGSALPEWEPGAHIDITVVDDGERYVRNYSLCGDPRDSHRYQIAVLRCVDGRGGSDAVHRRLGPGSVVTVSRPRNLFEFRPDVTKPVFFIAGGIGITPMLPMVRQASQRNMNWQALYLGRNSSTMALSEELSALGEQPQQVRLHHSEDNGILNLAQLTAQFPVGTQVYACGPDPLLSALTELHAKTSAWDLQLERFAAPITETVDTAFEVVVDSTGDAYEIKAGCSILSVLREKGFNVDFSCATGVCGTCETSVLDGEPEHRDAVLTDEERESNETMMICVSRAKSARIVLDI